MRSDRNQLLHLKVQVIFTKYNIAKCQVSSKSFKRFWKYGAKLRPFHYLAVGVGPVGPQPLLLQLLLLQLLGLLLYIYPAVASYRQLAFCLSVS